MVCREFQKWDYAVEVHFERGDVSPVQWHWTKSSRRDVRSGNADSDDVAQATKKSPQYVT
jgi:hypothetical protein